MEEPEQEQPSTSDDGEDGLDWGKLTQVARAEKLLNQDGFAQQKKRIEDLEARLCILKKTQAINARKAITEGAKFVMHRGWDEQLKLVWYDSSTHPPAIKWESSTTIPKMSKKSHAIKQHFYSQPAPNMASIAVAAYVIAPKAPKKPPGQEQVHGQKKNTNEVFGKVDTSAKSRANRCFSIVFQDNSALHLEVPETGNGRSRNEWVEAFKGILNEHFEDVPPGALPEG